MSTTDGQVLVGVCGGISAYKSVELVRLLVKAGMRPQVVMTPAACRFVTPLTFAAVSQSPVVDDAEAWSAASGGFDHIAAARGASVAIVAPATANTIAKLACGAADNVLCAALLAFRGPVVLAPAMNWAMREHPATVANLELLSSRGVEVIDGAAGELACGESGAGRMASPETLCTAVQRALGRLAKGPLAGRRVVITAGGTREAIDAVRYVGNRSSGKMGRALADAAARRGAEVTLITTRPVSEVPYAVVAVESAAEMALAVQTASADGGVLIMAAAVADFRPAAPTDGKIARGERDSLRLDLVRTVDVLASAARPGLYRVGFAAEIGPDLARAREKFAAKGVDLLVYNDIAAEGIGIGADDNAVTIIAADGEVEIGRSSKADCATAIIAEIERRLPAS